MGFRDKVIALNEVPSQVKTMTALIIMVGLVAVVALSLAAVALKANGGNAGGVMANAN